MQFDNQKTRNVADVVAKILAGGTVSEELKGDQHQIDKNKNGKIDKQDFEMLRKEKGVKQEASCGKMKKEEVDLNESDFEVGDKVKCKASGSEGEVVKLDEPQTGKYYTVKREDGKTMKYAPDELSLMKEAVTRTVKNGVTTVTYTGDDAKKRRATPGKFGYGPSRAKSLAKMGMQSTMKKEDNEQLDEYTPGETGVTRVQARAYGASEKPKDPLHDIKGPSKKALNKIAKKKPFKEMLDLYAEKGLSALSEMVVKEEPDQETYEKELEMAKKKATQKKTPEEESQVAKSLVQTVKVEEVDQIDEKEMTSAEMEKREDIVKGMKKNLKGFKERYGKNAKDVMYATATKQAMKDED